MHYSQSICLWVQDEGKFQFLAFFLFALYLKQFGLPHGVNKTAMLFSPQKNTIALMDCAFITEQINFFHPLHNIKERIISVGIVPGES